jgi:hypothetical protein
MSWLKLTSESLFLMKGGTNEYLKKIDLQTHETLSDKESRVDIPKDWLTESNAPRTIIIDVGSTENPSESIANFDPDDVFKKIIKRSNWGAASPTSKFEIVDRPQYIVIHHTDTIPASSDLKAAKQVVKNIQKFHMDPVPMGNGWSDIGYNFLNTIGGHLIEGRFSSLEEAIKGNSVRGAHAGMIDGNRSPGVANEGNFTTKKMDSTQWDSLVNLCAALCQSCDIDPAQIRGHRDFVPTDCPGEWLYNQLPQLIKEVAQKLAS